MRVVAGEAGGRHLVAPEGTTTRPTSDRVRESMFNMLFSLNALEGARVLDLYAGSGSLGIEALSRGAHECVFVEQDRDALETIRHNLDTIGFTNRCTVVAGDVLEWMKHRSEGFGTFDLILADPPYIDEPWQSILDAIGGQLLAENGLVVAESSSQVDVQPGWDAIRNKKYGATLVTVFERVDASVEGGG